VTGRLQVCTSDAQTVAVGANVIFDSPPAIVTGGIIATPALTSTGLYLIENPGYYLVTYGVSTDICIRQDPITFALALAGPGAVEPTFVSCSELYIGNCDQLYTMTTLIQVTEANTTISVINTSSIPVEIDATAGVRAFLTIVES